MKTILLFLLVTCSISGCMYTRQLSPEKINLADHGLTEIPDSVFEKRQLSYLNLGTSWLTLARTDTPLDSLSGNRISNIPERIGNLKHLKYLSLQKNQITVLPQNMSRLKELEVLDLSFNKNLDVNLAMPVILELPKLKELNLYGIASALRDSNEVRRIVAGRNIKLSITRSDVEHNYGRQLHSEKN